MTLGIQRGIKDRWRNFLHNSSSIPGDGSAEFRMRQRRRRSCCWERQDGRSGAASAAAVVVLSSASKISSGLCRVRAPALQWKFSTFPREGTATVSAAPQCIEEKSGLSRLLLHWTEMKGRAEVPKHRQMSPKRAAGATLIFGQHAAAAASFAEKKICLVIRGYLGRCCVPNRSSRHCHRSESGS